MLHYTHEQYLDDLFTIREEILTLVMRGHTNINLIGLHRGSLPMAVHLSNILPAKMSIINFQTRDGDMKTPEFAINTIEQDDTIIVLDDIYDSGHTIQEVKKMLEDMYPEQYVKPMVLFGKENEDDCYYVREHTGDWIVFPWEEDDN